jgi:hypothetical protein
MLGARSFVNWPCQTLIGVLGLTSACCSMNVTL